MVAIKVKSIFFFFFLPPSFFGEIVPFAPAASFDDGKLWNAHLFFPHFLRFYGLVTAGIGAIPFEYTFLEQPPIQPPYLLGK